MVNPLPVPPSTAADAKNRAFRTFLQGIGTDVAIAVLPVLYDAVTNASVAGSAQYWTVVGISVAKTAVITGIAYTMRRLKAPNV